MLEGEIYLQVEKLGERRVIELFRRAFGEVPGTPIPFGDDVSAIELGHGLLGVLKVDMLVRKTDVPKGMTFRQMGWKALVMGISDFAAKGVRPQAALVAVGLPRNLSQRAVREIARGLKDAATHYSVQLLGGDTNEAEDLTITPALFGVCPRSGVIPRSGAKCGDLLAVSGMFGRTAAGLRILLGKYKVSSADRRKIVKSVYRPLARLDVGLKLKSLGATATVDSSDGLALSLYALSRASHIGFEVNSLPIASEAEKFAITNQLDPFELVFYGGEEYELVATVNPEIYETTRRQLRSMLIPIGHAVKGNRLTYRREADKRRILPRGWEHFKVAPTL